jgi:hypothetical protein
MKIRIRRSDEVEWVWIFVRPDLWEDWFLTFEAARVNAWEYIRAHSGKRR